ncbi:MAG: hypothetical protein DRP87_04680 [Spirochaetes bacterium]|nr:MAG: hypothetical protein DRP87_04680 [Spirochaetota bacterium]
MLNREIKWYFPETEEEAVAVKRENVDTLYHAGGTGILRTKSQKIKGLIDLSALDLNYIKKEGNTIRIGATSTYSQICKTSLTEASLQMLKGAVSRAGSTLLRNRITMGGSLIDAPYWSDLFSTLLCLGAHLTYRRLDLTVETCTVKEFLDRRLKKENVLIREVILPVKEDLIFFVRRFTRVFFDYPVFNLAFCAKRVKKKGGEYAIGEPAIFVTGVKRFYRELTEAEEFINNNIVDSRLIEECMKHVDAEFTPDRNFGAEYKLLMLKSLFKDGLEELLPNFIKTGDQ